MNKLRLIAVLTVFSAGLSACSSGASTIPTTSVSAHQTIPHQADGGGQEPGPGH